MDANSSSFALEFATATSFLLLAGAFWIVTSLGQWALAPADRLAAAASAVRVQTRFSLSELLMLLVQVQVASAISVWFSAQNPRWAISACAAASGGVAAMWWVSLRHLTVCRIVCRRRRGAFLSIVAPLTCIAIALGLWFNGRAVVQIITTGDYAVTGWLAGNLAALIAFVVCRRLTEWVLRAADVDAPAPVACR